MAAGGRNAALDSLRAIAVSLVLLHHVFGIFFEFGDFGRIGVYLFFLISGYCIFMATEEDERPDIPRFIARRIFRLFPAYWVSVATMAFVSTYGAPSDYFINLTMLQAAFGVPHVSGVYWTLTIELIFYALIILFICSGLPRTPRTIAALIFFMLASAFCISALRYFTNIALPFAHLLFAATFFMGGIFRALDRGPNTNLFCTIIAGYIATIFCVSVFVYGADRIGVDTWASHFGNYVIALGLFIVFFYIWPIRARAIVYVGTISYSIYLFHAPVFRAAAAAGLPGGLFGDIIGIAAVLSVAAFIYSVVEAPMIKVGRIMMKWRVA